MEKTPWKINLFAKADPIISERILPIVLQIPTVSRPLNQAAKTRGSFQYEKIPREKPILGQMVSEKTATSTWTLKNLPQTWREGWTGDPFYPLPISLDLQTLVVGKKI